MNRRHLALATGLILCTGAAATRHAASAPDLSFARKTSASYAIRNNGSAHHEERYSLEGISEDSRVAKVDKAATDAGFTLRAAIPLGDRQFIYADSHGRTLTFHTSTRNGPELTYDDGPVSRLRSITGPMLMRLRNRINGSGYTIPCSNMTILVEYFDRDD
ncbi:MAG: hypothetical protein QOJ65_1141 [Fimbriimonadaceae bacterium]|jgi:hypothetical protein|nr:hypothetical protein [Fimbriimonadaceae bacterium]